MTEIYAQIAKLSSKFTTMAYGITTDKNKIDNAVQELMLYFLQMNPKTLSDIYDKDGILGITRYGAVALRRALISMKSIIHILTALFIIALKLLVEGIMYLMILIIKICIIFQMKYTTLTNGKS